ncbi:MAG TPA: hypothetical protein DDW50_19720 [Firmicutes bacterium]|nr:hypothetical protein [Bacillota bacterium]
MIAMNRMKQQKIVLLVAFLVIPLLLLVFSFYPALKLIHLSFMEWNGYDPEMSFVGFDNYMDVFSDDMVLKLLILCPIF